MIRLDEVSHHYGGGSTRRQVLFDVCARVDAGEIVLLTGPSGSGKSTLLTLIGALRSAQTGSMTVLGQELREASADTLLGVRRQIGYIFQKHNLLDCLTVLQNVQVSLAAHGDIDRPMARRRAVDMLEAVGLSAHLDRHPRQLSGGQQQRVAIARALAGRPRIILADEPTASLDSASGSEVAVRIRELVKREGCAAVVVTHDQRILRIADRVLQMEDGRLTAGPAVAEQTLGAHGVASNSAATSPSTGVPGSMPNRWQTVGWMSTARMLGTCLPAGMPAPQAYKIPSTPGVSGG